MYPLFCIFPGHTVIKDHEIFTILTQEDVDRQIVKSSTEIIVKICDEKGITNSIPLSSLETRLQFTYLNHLNFLHEKDLRNYHIWYVLLFTWLLYYSYHFFYYYPL